MHLDLLTHSPNFHNSKSKNITLCSKSSSAITDLNPASPRKVFGAITDPNLKIDLIFAFSFFLLASITVMTREREREQMEDISKYAHSPAHVAVARRDHAALRHLVSTIPRLAKAGEVNTEAESLAAELKADEVSTVIDRRDVPGRETPLHLAVRLRDVVSAEILMTAGADWSLQNEHGWSALQEAVCTREEAIAVIIARHYQPLAWAKWCRRLPRIVASAARIRDFYMEISFHFESSVIPFIGRIAPSDTYRIWKRGSNLRADMTLAGFDGFRIQRSDQTFLFLGEGYASEDGKLNLPPGSLLALAHKEKEVTNALEGAGTQPTEAEVNHEVSLMSQTNMYRPGIDVTQAELVPHLNWRRQEKTEIVGNWKARVYDMLHVMVSVKSRRVPGAMTDEELFAVDDGESMVNGDNNDDQYDDVLTAEERMQLDSALRMGNSDAICQDEEPGGGFDGHENGSNGGGVKEKKVWFGWNKKNMKGGDEPEDLKTTKKFSGDQQKPQPQSEFVKEDPAETKKGKDKNIRRKKKKGGINESKNESEFKKGLRPVLWLTPDFPLKTDELLPLLDILANKVKAIRRLRELLTTKLPLGTFPVKVAIPIVPTIRVLVTFTKFEDLQPAEEFSTPPSSPAYFQDAKSKESEGSTSWISWMKGSRGTQSSDSDSHKFKDEMDPFSIPSDYKWVDANERKRRMKAKRAKSKKHKKQTVAKGGDGMQLGSDDVEEY
ncbi:Ankyrin repeat domain-containing protein 13B [Glycine soja]